jgi:predicted CXXCH cytochrome family protein
VSSGNDRRPERRTGRGRAVPYVLCCLMLLGRGTLHAQHAGVAATLHNLSVSGPGEIRAVSETEICKFCHIPHSAVVPTPLWSQKLSRAQYQVPSVRDRGGRPAAGRQPDGASRLCMSCHDGTVALGDIGGEPRPIALSGAQRLGAGRRGYLGTDLSGSHPISFVVSDITRDAGGGLRDMGTTPVLEMMRGQGVRLDAQGKMQCTTCHDPHSDRYYQEGSVPRFWVRPTEEEVCLSCHELQ